MSRETGRARTSGAQVRLHRVLADDAVIGKGIDGLVRHGIDGVRADERLDVTHIVVEGILGARAGPEGALHAGPLLLKRPPALAAEEPLKGLVRQLGIGNRRRPQELLGTWLLTATRTRPDTMPEQLVHQHIDAAQEKAGDRGHMLQRLALSRAPFQGCDVCLSYRLVVFDGEE
jgi:hypothetical protein